MVTSSAAAATASTSATVTGLTRGADLAGASTFTAGLGVGLASAGFTAGLGVGLVAAGTAAGFDAGLAAAAFTAVFAAGFAAAFAGAPFAAGTLVEETLVGAGFADGALGVDDFTADFTVDLAVGLGVALTCTCLRIFGRRGRTGPLHSHCGTSRRDPRGRGTHSCARCTSSLMTQPR